MLSRLFYELRVNNAQYVSNCETHTV